jgi:hypothetical protein
MSKATELTPVGYYCDHSDEPGNARTHHGWEWVEGQGNVFQHQPNIISAQIGFQEYLKPEERDRRCPRAEAVYPASVVRHLTAEIAELQAKLSARERYVQHLQSATVCPSTATAMTVGTSRCALPIRHRGDHQNASKNHFWSDEYADQPEVSS